LKKGRCTLSPPMEPVLVERQSIPSAQKLVRLCCFLAEQTLLKLQLGRQCPQRSRYIALRVNAHRGQVFIPQCRSTGHWSAGMSRPLLIVCSSVQPCRLESCSTLACAGLCDPLHTAHRAKTMSQVYPLWAELSRVKFNRIVTDVLHRLLQVAERGLSILPLPNMLREGPGYHTRKGGHFTRD
jgi:hypothetical protein